MQHWQNVAGGAAFDLGIATAALREVGNAVIDGEWWAGWVVEYLCGAPVPSGIGSIQWDAR